MSKSIRRLLSTSILILALALPTAASARFRFQGYAESQPSGTATPVVQQPTRVVTPAQPTAQGFHWGDAALGAAGGLAVSIVLGLGIGAQRRRTHHPLAS